MPASLRSVRGLRPLCPFLGQAALHSLVVGWSELLRVGRPQWVRVQSGGTPRSKTTPQPVVWASLPLRHWCRLGREARLGLQIPRLLGDVLVVVLRRGN